MNTFIMIQARQGSKRFRNKVLNKVNDLELVKIQYKRLQKIKSKKKIIFLIPQKKNEELRSFLIFNKINFFLGSEKNVLSRYYNASKKFNAKKIIRITGDCPLIDYRLIDKLIKSFNITKVDYISNTLKRTFPHGMDMEMFSFQTLKKIWLLAKSRYDKEHVTSYLTKNQNKFLIKHFLKTKNEKNFRITVDYKEDLKVVDKIVSHFKPNIYFSSNQIVKFLKSRPDIRKINLRYNMY